MKKDTQRQIFFHTVRQRLHQLVVRRTFKDRLFIKLFHDRQSLLQLYNALNGTQYDDSSELMITTIDDAIFMGMKNDCSFIVGNYLNLYEQQSTFNPNMPVRGLIYLAHIYEAYIHTHGLNLYGSGQIELPAPKYVVFYNGTAERPDVEELHISDAFGGSDSCLTFRATVYNINLGHNSELLEQCQTLAGYATLIDKIREYQTNGQTLEEAIDTACMYCIEHDLLKEFLLKHRSEVTNVLLTEYNPKKQRQMDIRDAKAEGRKIGFREGSIQTMIQIHIEERIPKEHTLIKLQDRFSLEPEDAERSYEEIKRHFISKN